MNTVISMLIYLCTVILMIGFLSYDASQQPMGTIDPARDFGAACDGNHDDRRAVFLATRLSQRLQLQIAPCPMGPIKLDDTSSGIKLDGVP